MPFARVVPVVDLKVRGLCVKPYPGHAHGCPNFFKKKGCPPRCPRLGDHFDLSMPCFIIWSEFDLAKHVRRMRDSHPGWSERQLTCCLYWQGTSRKKLTGEIAEFRARHPAYLVERCPEAMGLNVTATMSAAGVDLEWPPKRIVRTVAFAAVSRRSR